MSFNLIPQKYYYLCFRQLHLSNILGYGRFTYFNIHKNVTDPARQDPDYFEKEAEKLPLGRYMDKLNNILIKINNNRGINYFELLLGINIKNLNFVYISSIDNIKMGGEYKENTSNEEILKSEEESKKKNNNKRVEDLPLKFCDYIMLMFILTWLVWPIMSVYIYLNYDWDKIHEEFIERKIKEKKIKNKNF